MVPTSDFDSGGNNCDMLRVVDVDCTSGERIDVPVYARTLTSEPNARAAPTVPC